LIREGVVLQLDRLQVVAAWRVVMKKSAKNKRPSSVSPADVTRKASLKTLKPKEPTGSELRNVVGGLKRNPLG
jgi:hypothetical protein